jgi:GDPmannose 4,6-dehydratase
VTERALITGIAGQDGRLLARRLLAEGAEVHGVARDPSDPRVPRGVILHAVDLRDAEAVRGVLATLQPTHCYHLAALHRSSESKGDSLEHDAFVFRENLAMAEAVLFGVAQTNPSASVVLAGSCQMFGAPASAPQSEATPFAPDNAYALAKAVACELGRLLRRRGLRVATAILFQHESELRGSGFLSQRIARGAAAVARGDADAIELGRLDAVVDWLWAEDAVDALIRMARSAEPHDFVVAGGTPRTVRELAELALRFAGVAVEGRVREQPGLVRTDATAGVRAPYVGDAAALRRELGWSPTVTVEALVERLVAAACARA